jgi:probable phosphoglycerate mutase
MRINFIYVRHGQTLFNIKHLIQGKGDSPLTEKGIAQAYHLRSVLQKISFDLGVSSTSERARDTMHIILDGRCPYAYYKELKEISFGTLEGDPVSAAFEKSEDEDLWIPKQKDFTAYGGDNFSQAREKAEEKLIEIGRKHPGQTLLVVSHGALLKELFSHLDPNFKERVPNCSVSQLTYSHQHLSLIRPPEVL